MARRILDSHFHVFDLEARRTFPNRNASWDYPSATTESVLYRTISLEEASEFIGRASGVRNAVHVQTLDDSPEETQWLRDLAVRTGEAGLMAGLVAGLDLTNHPKLIQWIDTFQAWTPPTRPKFVGIRNLDEGRPADHILSEAYKGGLRIAMDRGLTVDLLVRPDHLRNVAVLAREFPDLRMVVDHLAKPLKYMGPDPAEPDVRGWKQDMAEVARSGPNVFVKLSGMISEAPDRDPRRHQPFVDHLLQEFGPRRCMFGSDWPVCRLGPGNPDHRDVVQLLEDLLAGLPEQDKDAIFHDNAVHFYGLQDVLV